MARLTKKQKNAIFKIVSRWAHTMAGTNAPNMTRIRELIDSAYTRQTRSRRVKVGKGKKQRTEWKTTSLKPPVLVTTSSPMAFRIAQSVIRGRLAKKDAVVAAESFGIDPGFIKSLRRDKLICVGDTSHWRRDNSPLYNTWHNTLMPYLTAAKHAMFMPQKDDGDTSSKRTLEKVREDHMRAQLAELNLPAQTLNEQTYALEHNHMRRISGTTRRSTGWGQSSQNMQFGNFFCNNPGADAVAKLADVPWTSTCENATFCRIENADLSGSWSTGSMDSELLLAMLGIKDIKHTWHLELAHETPLCMTFEHTVLLCNERPAIKRNSAGELHCDEGPAVVWPDGSGQYFLDGHALGALGHKIVSAPEDLTLDDINTEPNEEVKRLAIDKFGWGKYLDGIGAQVIDRRDNWVDNTIEALVRIRRVFNRPTWRGQSEEVVHEERKLILSCRSTARQYFLAVPETTRTCEEGQRWMSSGANTDYLAPMNRPVRLVGAS